MVTLRTNGEDKGKKEKRGARESEIFAPMLTEME